MQSTLIDGALPPNLFECLQRRLTSVDVDPFNRHSYWYPLGAPPRLLVEHAIVGLLRYIPNPETIRGVEWWVEAKPPRQGVRWHFDIDHEVEQREGRRVYPVHASILYFGSIGGPTVIVDQTARGESLTPPSPGEGVAYLPRPNRFGVFEGDKRHAVAASDETAAGLRLTMPLNWWPDKPEPPTCISPPYGDPEFACLDTPEDALGGGAALAQPAAPIRLSRTDLERLPERDNRPVWGAPAGWMGGV